MRRLGWIAVALACMALAGCYEDATPTRYEPGVYKGERDPLLDKLETGELHGELEQRFNRAARDR